VFPDPDGRNANVHDAPLVDGIGSLNKRRAATIRSSRLEPLLTVTQAAKILSVSERTVRRLIASGTMRGIWIGRSVRLGPGTSSDGLRVEVPVIIEHCCCRY
jgi:excisionase family DNA binding protein